MGGKQVMSTFNRLYLLTIALNSNKDEKYTAKQWTKLALKKEVTTSDILVVQTHLNLLSYLGFVNRYLNFYGKSQRYSYKLAQNHINLRKNI